MTRRRAARKKSRTSRTRRQRPARARWPGGTARRRWWRRLQWLPLSLQLAVGVIVLAVAVLLVNVTYQVVRKPTELFFPVSGTLNKTPRETWSAYAPIFIRHSTATITPEFLAALAQVEAAGNPVIRTYWRVSPKADPFDVYRPASSAVGMYQITDGTFRETRRYCIHNHVVVEDGPWNRPRTCWFNALYFRVVPSHAVEMTAAHLDRQVARILRRHGVRKASALQRQDVATLTHLCGPGMADGYVRRGFRFRPGQRCGDHDPRAYLSRAQAMTNVFRKLAAG
jgi:hypothetical protein